MKSFAYVSAQSPDSAVALVRDEGRFFAGGIDLLGELKETLASPKTLVNVKQIPDTDQIEVRQDRCILGANVTLEALAGNEQLARLHPGLTSAAAEVGSPQIRAIATVAGNLAQHSRCWYYRHRDVHCRKKGGTQCYARIGENKFHSLFTGCVCVSPVVSNLAVALAALDARVVVLRGRKTESLTVDQMFASAWSTPSAHNSLKPADLILRVEIPTLAGGRSAYLQISEKSDFDWALVSCSAAARVTGRTVTGVRVVLGAVAPIPWQSPEANRFLEGKIINDDVATEASNWVLREATPLSSNGYKLPIARALIRRCLKQLVG